MKGAQTRRFRLSSLPIPLSCQPDLACLSKTHSWGDGWFGGVIPAKTTVRPFIVHGWSCACYFVLLSRRNVSDRGNSEYLCLLLRLDCFESRGPAPGTHFQRPAMFGFN